MNYIKKITTSHNIHVLMINEWRNNQRIFTKSGLPTLPNYKPFYNCSNNALLIRNDIATGSEITLHKGNDPSQHINNIAYSTVIDNQPYTFISYYRTPKPNVKPTPLLNDLITLNALSDSNIIASGDLNLKHAIWGSKTTEPLAGDFIDELFQHPYKILNNGSPTHQAGNPLDISFTSDTIPSQNITWNVKPQWNPKYKYSDHHPILITIDTQHITPQTYISWNLCSTRWSQYSELIDNKLDINNLPTDIEEANKYISNIIKECALDTIGIKHHSKTNTPWINNKVIKLQQKKKKTPEKFTHH